jgi:hypothetical protein
MILAVRAGSSVLLSGHGGKGRPQGHKPLNLGAFVAGRGVVASPAHYVASPCWAASVAEII